MKKIIILSTDTLHHRYFFNKINDSGFFVEAILLETTSVSPEFKTGPFFHDEEYLFEKDHFFKETRSDLDGFEIKKVSAMNTSEALNILSESNPGFGIVFGTRKLSGKTIDCFEDGMINVHRGIAEEYRGVDSELWATYHGDYDNIGVTIHGVDTQLDTGSIIFQERLKLKKNMKIYQLRYYLTVIATDLVIKSLKLYLQGNLEHVKQKKHGRYYSFMPYDLKNVVAKKFNAYCEKL